MDETNRGVILQRELYLQEIHKALRKESDRINQVSDMRFSNVWKKQLEKYKLERMVN